MAGTQFRLEVQPHVPERLKALNELSDDLFYSWDQDVRGLFYRLDPELWDQCQHNPKLFLRRIAQDKLDKAVEDPSYIENYNRVLSAYNTYHRETVKTGLDKTLDPETELVAYFCAEFGFHESLPIYSGGLGILAGDHCKAASDLAVPFIAVGMLYRQGYFTQSIDAHGNQIAHYHPSNFANLPIKPAVDKEGNEVHVSVTLPGRSVTLKVWKVKVGRIQVYLLDSDLDANREDDRRITYQLYGGDKDTRIQQEIILGIAGVRALRALDISPTVWHINEGHAAFQIVERTRECVSNGMNFDAALELIAANTVFTTHTPVPAGHDIFEFDQMVHYFDDYVRELNIHLDDFLALGANPGNSQSFNMTALALRGSRHHNGVSRIHGKVASDMESYIWPQVPPEENPISYVTNGVHVATFLSREWAMLFNVRIGVEWRHELINADYWERVDEIPDHSYWSVRQSIKSGFFNDLKKRVQRQHERNGVSGALIQRLTSNLNEENANILTLGFARRFATYKRATLLFRDPERLARILNNPERPVMIVFAGKAHPHDVPGQQLIRTIHEFSMRPEFVGKLILLENYDLSLGRKMVRSVDIWLNTPEFPMEASGTSGMKAGLNGVLNLSVLDGWWDEGYDGDNGWSVTPHGDQYDNEFRDQQESSELLDILENEIAPLYYDRGNRGYSEGWVRKSKNSMKTLIHQFNSQRMVRDYVKDFYVPASQQQQKLSIDDGEPATRLSQWKHNVFKAWEGVKIRRINHPAEHIYHDESLTLQVAVKLNGLFPEDVVVECVVGEQDEQEKFHAVACHKLEAAGDYEQGETMFQVNMDPPLSGLQYYKIRVYPYHELLSHPFETGCMIWL